MNRLLRLYCFSIHTMPAVMINWMSSGCKWWIGYRVLYSSQKPCRPQHINSSLFTTSSTGISACIDIFSIYMTLCFYAIKPKSSTLLQIVTQICSSHDVGNWNTIVKANVKKVLIQGLKNTAINFLCYLLICLWTGWHSHLTISQYFFEVLSCVVPLYTN